MMDLCSADVADGGEAHSIEGCGDVAGDARAGRTDYLPSNPYFDPLDPTQRFEYFEGTGLRAVDGHTGVPKIATAYIKSMTLPSGERYLSGIISLEGFDLLISGNVETGETIARRADPNTYPNMPQPIQVDEDEDEFDGEDGLPAVVDRGRKLKKNLRSGGGGPGRAPNPFDEQIKRQVDRHLEKEKRRRDRQRRMQSDYGGVIDMLVGGAVSYFCSFACSLHLPL